MPGTWFKAGGEREGWEEPCCLGGAGATEGNRSQLLPSQPSWPVAEGTPTASACPSNSGWMMGTIKTGRHSLSILKHSDRSSLNIL